MKATSSSQTNFGKGYSIALASAAVLSTTAIFIRYLTETTAIRPLVLAFWRDVFVVLTLLPVLVLVRPRLLRIRRRQMFYLLAYGLALALFNSLMTIAIALNGAAVSTVLVYCSAGFTALLGWWFLGEHIDPVKLAVIGVSLAGCFLVSDALHAEAWRNNFLGIFTGILSGLGYAVYSLMGRSAAQRGLNPWTTLLYTFGFAALFLGLFNLVPGGWLPGAALTPADFLVLGKALPAWGVLFLLAAGPTLIGFGLYNTSLSYLPSSLVNLIVTVEPAITAGVAYFVLGERLTLVQVGGSLLILGGVVFLRIYEGRQTHKLEILPAGVQDFSLRSK